MRFEAKERLFMSWAGLRGAVPIVLATYPMAAGLPTGQDVFNLVFFAVVLSVGIQGSTLGVLARKFELSTPSRPQPRYGLELVTMAHSDLDLVVVDLPDPQGRPGPRLRDLTLPPGAILTLVTRGDKVVAPTGNTRLLGWDQVTVLAHAKDEDDVRAALLEPFDLPIEAEQPETHAEPSVAESDGHPLRDHVVLLGHGGVGSVLTRFLRLREIPFVVIEQDHTTAAALRSQGERVLHGHGEDPRLLEQAGIKDARMLLVTATQPVSARRAIEHAQRMNPQLEVIARVHHDSLLSALSGMPRTQVVQGDVELAYAMARFMLLASGVSAIETEALILDARRGEAGTTPTRFMEIPIPPASPVVGQKLADLALPRGSLVVKILRGGDAIVPSGQSAIRADDVLFVLTDLDQARAIEQLVNPPV
jgi:Trk K+ transport system NAD-binding subunit